MKNNNSLVLGWFFWLIAAIFYSLDYFQHTAPSVLIKPIANSMGVGVENIAYIMSVYFPIYAISQIPAGILLDKYGSRIVLSISCLIMSLGVILFAFNPTEINMLIGRILIAIGSAVAFIGCLKVASDVLPSKYFSIAVGLTNTLGVLGGIFGQVVLNDLVNDFGWQASFVYIGFIGIMWATIMAVFLFYKIDKKSTVILGKNISFKEKLTLLKNKELWLLAIYSGLMVGIVVNAFSELYDVLFLQYAYHLTDEQASKISIMMFIGIAFGGPLHGLISTTFDKKKWMLLSNIITIIIFACVILLNNNISVNFLYIIFFLIGFFVSSMLLAFSIVEEIFPEHMSATVLAIINMTIGLCGAIFQNAISYISSNLNNGPIIEGHITANIFQKSFVFLLVPLLLSTIIILFLNYKKSKNL